MKKLLVLCLLLLALGLVGCAKSVIWVNGHPYVVEVGPYNAQTLEPTVEVWPTLAPTPTAEVDTCYVSTSIPSYINMRNAPSLTALIVDQMPADRFPAWAQTENDHWQWYKIQYQQQFVWVAAVNALMIEGDCEHVPQEPPFE